MHTKPAGEFVPGEVICAGDGVMFEVMAVQSAATMVTLTVRPMFRGFYSSFRGWGETKPVRFRKSTRVYFGGLASEQGETEASQ